MLTFVFVPEDRRTIVGYSLSCESAAMTASPEDVSAASSAALIFFVE